MLICGGRVVDPAQGIDALRDVRLTNVVVAIGEHLEPERGEAVIDASGAVVAPGFIDMHVHLREPGNPEKETIETGTEAALRGGFTAVACMPNTLPALDAPESIAQLRESGRCRIYPVAAITRGRAGMQPCEYSALTAAGAVAFSDDGESVMDARVLCDAAIRARETAGPFISHCEDPGLRPLHPTLSESVVVARDLLIALETAKAWHIAHLSTRLSLELLAFVRARGAAVSAEATPHHLFFTDESARTLGPAGNVNPPLRSTEDTRALRDAVRDGRIDALASDHAPHRFEDKAGDAAAAGFTGLEVAVGAYAAALPDLPLPRFVALLSREPARILRIPGGTLVPGSPADITLFWDRPWHVDARTFASKGKVTPFDGMTLPRRAIAVVVDGELRYDIRAGTPVA